MKINASPAIAFSALENSLSGNYVLDAGRWSAATFTPSYLRFLMKRRSARPFAVEIKHSRSSPAPSHDIFGDRRAIPQRSQAVVEPRRARSLAFEPIEHSEVTMASKPAEQQTRRVLPALRPIFALSEPEPTEVPEKEVQTPVRARARRAPRRVSQRANPVAPDLDIQMTAPAPKPIASEPVQSVETQTPHGQPSPQSVSRRGGWRTRQDRSSLPPGERWKHRLLPRIR